MSTFMSLSDEWKAYYHQNFGDFQRPRIIGSRQLKHPTAYVLALLNELSDWAFDEQRAPPFKGRWRSLFKAPEDRPLDLEIGTGNGIHLAWRAFHHPDRLIIGIELKFKPLIQTVRRALRLGCVNAIGVRYHAFNLDELFEENEIDDLYIFFPDPWVTPRKPKNRIINPRTAVLYALLQKPNARLYLKTDNSEMYQWCLQCLEKSPYEVQVACENLHRSPWSLKHPITQFEQIFIRQKLPIFYIEAQNHKLHKPVTRF